MISVCVHDAKLVMLKRIPSSCQGKIQIFSSGLMSPTHCRPQRGSLFVLLRGTIMMTIPKENTIHHEEDECCYSDVMITRDDSYWYYQCDDPCDHRSSCPPGYAWRRMITIRGHSNDSVYLGIATLIEIQIIIDMM